MLARALRVADRLTRALALAGAALLVVCMLVTVADVALRRTVGIAIIGTVDLTQLFVMAAVFTAIPYAFLTGSHVSVDLFVDRLGPRAAELGKAFGALLGCILMALVFRYGLAQAQLQLAYGDVSQTIGIPILWYWLPLLAGGALATLATLLLGLAGLAAALRRGS